MKKRKIQKKGGLLAAIPFILVAAVVILVLFFLPETTKAPEPDKQEVISQSREREYRFTEKKITYAFGTDGILTVSGSGSTPSFDTTEAAQKYYLEKLYKEHTGQKPKSVEQASLFTVVLERVTEIKVEEGITALGDGSLSPFFYAETVTLPESLQRVGDYVFLAAGQYTGQKPVYYGLENRTIQQTDTSFMSVAEVSGTGTLTATGGDTLRSKDEQGTMPEEELLLYSINLGDNVEASLYENGVLYVSGFGSTYDFESSAALKEYILDELHLVSRLEAEEKWFNLVTEIVIADTVERIGDNALAGYEAALLVTAENLKTMGRQAFFRCGRKAGADTLWNINPDVTEQ